MELPSGETFVVPPEGIDVPSHLESEVRAALPNVFGIEEVIEAPAAPAKAAKKLEE